MKPRIMKPRERKRLIERIGVEGSVGRRILELMEGLGFVLVGAEDLDHLSRAVLRFDEGNYLTTITIEDSPRGGRSA